MSSYPYCAENETLCSVFCRIRKLLWFYLQWNYNQTLSTSKFLFDVCGHSYVLLGYSIQLCNMNKLWIEAKWHLRINYGLQHSKVMLKKKKFLNNSFLFHVFKHFFTIRIMRLTRRRFNQRFDSKKNPDSFLKLLVFTEDSFYLSFKDLSVNLVFAMVLRWDTWLGRYMKGQHEWSVWMSFIYWCLIVTVQNMCVREREHL